MRSFRPLRSALLALALLLPPAAAGVQVGEVVSLGRTVVNTATRLRVYGDRLGITAVTDLRCETTPATARRPCARRRPG